MDHLSAEPAAGIRSFLLTNPFYAMSKIYRVIVVDGALPPLWMTADMVAASTAAGGPWWFRRLR